LRQIGLGWNQALLFVEFLKKEKESDSGEYGDDSYHGERKLYEGIYNKQDQPEDGS
jgi:hypothetical protein